MDWGFGTGMCTLRYMEWLTNGDLLYSTENSTQYSVIIYLEKESKKKNGCVYLYNTPPTCPDHSRPHGVRELRIWGRGYYSVFSGCFSKKSLDLLFEEDESFWKISAFPSFKEGVEGGMLERTGFVVLGMNGPLSFLGPHLQHAEVPRLAVQLEM